MLPICCSAVMSYGIVLLGVCHVRTSCLNCRTAPVTIPKICATGFNRSYCGKNAVMYGKGVYFANNSLYSNRYSHPDTKGVKRMFLCRVAVGEFCLGTDGMTAPNERNAKTHILFDSTTDNMDPAKRDVSVCVPRAKGALLPVRICLAFNRLATPSSASFSQLHVDALLFSSCVRLNGCAPDVRCVPRRAGLPGLLVRVHAGKVKTREAQSHFDRVRECVVKCWAASKLETRDHDPRVSEPFPSPSAEARNGDSSREAKIKRERAK